MPPRRKQKPAYKTHRAAMERMVARHKTMILHSVYDVQLPKIIALVRRHGKLEKAAVKAGKAVAKTVLVPPATVAKMVAGLSVIGIATAPLWRNALSNAYEGATIEASIFVNDITGVQSSLDFQDLVDTYLREKGAQKIDGILDEDQRWMSGLLRNDAQAGKSIDEIVGDITDRFPDYSDGRAGTIARTEIHQASGYATNEMMKDAAPGMQKVWICTFENSREAHMDADGQSVPVGEPFTVMDEEVDFPGDGSEANAINCNCEMEFTPASSEETE